MKAMNKKIKVLIVVIVVVAIAIAGFGLSQMMVKEEDDSNKIVVACLNLKGAKLVMMDFGSVEIETVNIDSNKFTKEWALEVGRSYNLNVTDEAGAFQGITAYVPMSVSLGHAYILEWNSTSQILNIDFVNKISSLQGYLDEWQG